MAQLLPHSAAALAYGSNIDVAGLEVKSDPLVEDFLVRRIFVRGAKALEHPGRPSLKGR